MMTKKEYEENTDYRMSYEDYTKCYCPDCPNRDKCPHKDAYRRYPTIDGGLGLCPNLSKR